MLKSLSLIVMLLSMSGLLQGCDAANAKDSTAPDSTAASLNSLCIAGATIENQSVDCGGARIGLSCNGDDEHQPPVLVLKNASVKNLIIRADGGSNGINCVSGECVLENVVWEDICEDAASLIDDGQRLTIKGGWAFNSKDGVGGKPDKIFQHNAGPGSTIVITDGFTAKGENGKLWRSCGNCKYNTGPRHLIVDNVRIEGKIHAVAGPNINQGYNDTVKISHLMIENYKAGKPKVCRTFKGSTREKMTVDSEPLEEEWNTYNCQVSPTDIIAFKAG